MVNLEKTNLLMKNHICYSKVHDYSNDKDNECPICFEEINSKKMKTLSCGHKFHKYCIDSWIKINPICPYCRKYMINHFECSIKYKYLTKKCRIYLDEEKFSKIIIDVYTKFINKPTKKYIIPITYVKSIENINKTCVLYFKDTNKGPINKYTLIFSNNNNSKQFVEKMTKIFNEFYKFYTSTQIIA